MNILAVNPWIVDYAAYDFWLKPYGFLAILTYLATKGVNIDYIDCLDKKISRGTFGRGKYYSEIIEKPPLHQSVPRYFKRYGLTPAEFKSSLNGKNPDYLLVTSSMTYWYPAVIEAVKLLKVQFPQVPLILGGTYATLCAEHAKETIPYDFNFGSRDLQKFFKLLGLHFNLKEFYSTLPDYEKFYRHNDYIVLRTSWGCPFNCSFCAIKKLAVCFFRIPAEKIVNFILSYARKGVKDFVLYDDAFLYQPAYAKKLLSQISSLKLNISFHTPNALHLKFLDRTLARLLKQAGFINPHFGLETLNPRLQKLWGDKVNPEDLTRGVKLLKEGGFKAGEFSVYLLLGHPGQNLKELKEDVKFLNSLGARISLAEFSPVPGTKIFKKHAASLREPLLHNNSTFGFFQKEKIKEFWEIKNVVRDLNRNFDS